LDIGVAPLHRLSIPSQPLTIYHKKDKSHLYGSDISVGFTNGSDANDVTDSENDEDDDEKPNKADEDEEDRSESPPKPKRKRGRPPKVPKVEEKPPKERWVIFYFSVFFLACFLSRVFSISPRFYLVPPLKCHFLFFCSTENNRKT
jgi:hypothetical protein